MKFNELIEEIYTALSGMHAADQFRPIPSTKEEDTIDIDSPEITKKALKALMVLKDKDPEMFNKFISRLLQIANS